MNEHEYAETWPEDHPSFVRLTWDSEWVPLCGCGELLKPHQTPMSNYICESDAHWPQPWRMHLIWAEDWPDYWDDRCEDCEELEGDCSCAS